MESFAKNNRILSLDSLRGTILILMALDHSAHMVSGTHSNEFWGMTLPHYDSALSFLNRFVTHICAPGFFLLMGVAIILYAESRRRSGWEEFKINQFLISRGAFIIFLQLILMFARAMGEISAPDAPDAFIMPGSGVEGNRVIPFLYFGVLYALGFAMIILTFLRNIKTSILMIITISLFLLTQIIIPGPEKVQTIYPPIVRLLFIPGETDFWRVSYPVIPWMGFTCLGLVIGKSLLKDKSQTYRKVLLSGFGLLIFFLLIRIIGKFGNFHERGEGWIDFFNVTKYPPSLSFSSLTLGINLLLLYLYGKLEERNPERGKILRVFGRTPLFYYFLHFTIYGLMSTFIPDNIPFYSIYIIWISGLIIMFPLCYGYGRFKRNRPLKSLWRFL